MTSSERAIVSLPFVTRVAHHTKIQVALHEKCPTKPYRNLCSRCETLWSIRIGLPTVTRMPIWLHHRYRIVLPIITSRGVKYTHDINCTVLHSDRGPLGLCVISQASTQKVIPVGDGGAKHRSIDPPTPRHNVADPHAVAAFEHGGWRPSNRPSSPHDSLVLGVRLNITHQSILFW